MLKSHWSYQQWHIYSITSMKTFLLLAVIMPGFSQAYGKLAELADI
jgi:hypothetical protein